MGMQGSAVVESDEQVLADRIGIDQGRAGQIDTSEPWVPGDTTQAFLAGESPADLVGQPPNGVALGHGQIPSAALRPSSSIALPFDRRAKSVGRPAPPS